MRDRCVCEQIIIVSNRGSARRGALGDCREPHSELTYLGVRRLGYLSTTFLHHREAVARGITFWPVPEELSMRPT